MNIICIYNSLFYIVSVYIGICWKLYIKSTYYFIIKSIKLAFSISFESDTTLSYYTKHDFIFYVLSDFENEQFSNAMNLSENVSIIRVFEFSLNSNWWMFSLTLPMNAWRIYLVWKKYPVVHNRWNKFQNDKKIYEQSVSFNKVPTYVLEHLNRLIFNVPWFNFINILVDCIQTK